ncbi:hypothetical protein [Parvularcula maris]|uniref:Uncharacterized protein n=1 Tax=Parvularcula maris TaxID=2965077 RepID=A0A9X2RJI7_9PROT|nr:hypothetical protein [Parvularcula maris]MCQ8184772.1 hypothetical protein [Parvularcula maris]
MIQTKTLAYGMLAVSFSCILLAVLLGVAAAEGEWDKAQVIASTAALAGVAEISFWVGGGLLGFSAIKRKRASLARTANRLTLWRRS